MEKSCCLGIISNNLDVRFVPAFPRPEKQVPYQYGVLLTIWGLHPLAVPFVRVNKFRIFGKVDYSTYLTAKISLI